MKIDDASLLAYVDGELSAGECAQIERAIDESPELASRVSMLRVSHLPYREAFGQQSLPPVPESLSRNLDEMIRRHRANESSDTEPHARGNVHPLKPRARARALPWLSWPKLAVAFVAGAFCCGLALHFVPQFIGGNGAAIEASNDSGMSPWIEAAASYQQLYSRDTVALLQPDTRVTKATVADIRQLDNLALQIPDLRNQGLTFKRVQRLRFHDRPLVQIVYLPEQGKPVALCVLKEAKEDAGPSSGKVGGMNVVAWRRAQLGYALIAAPGTVDLDALGRQLYEGQAQSVIGRNDAGGDEPRS